MVLATSTTRSYSSFSAVRACRFLAASASRSRRIRSSSRRRSSSASVTLGTTGPPTRAALRSGRRAARRAAAARARRGGGSPRGVRPPRRASRRPPRGGARSATGALGRLPVGLLLAASVAVAAIRLGGASSLARRLRLGVDSHLLRHCGGRSGAARRGATRRRDRCVNWLRWGSRRGADASGFVLNVTLPPIDASDHRFIDTCNAL